MSSTNCFTTAVIREEINKEVPTSFAKANDQLLEREVEALLDLFCPVSLSAANPPLSLMERIKYLVTYVVKDMKEFP